MTLHKRLNIKDNSNVLAAKDLLMVPFTEK